MKLERLQQLTNKRVLIVGFGREGQSTYRFLRNTKAGLVIGICDRREIDSKDLELVSDLDKISNSSTTFHFGEDYLVSIRDYDIIIRSPGISTKKLEPFLREGQEVTSNARLFFELCENVIIGITGTMGKSTTTSLIYEMLRKSGVPAVINGNIGLPPLSTIDSLTKDTIVVMELSSHQLMDFDHSPNVAIVLDIVPEHGDYYSSFEEYVDAKRPIALYQNTSDTIIYNYDSNTSSGLASSSQATQRIAVSMKRINEPNACFLESEHIYFRLDGITERIMHVSEIKLVGRFNFYNVAAAISAVRVCGIPAEAAARTASEFSGLDHRLQWVTKKGGVNFYNDSLSTAPEMSIAAIKSFDFQKIALIAGGYDRGQDFSELASTILSHNVSVLILLPDTGTKLWNAIEAAGEINKTSNLPECFFIDSMCEAVRVAHDKVQPSGVVLLSPASASFGRFRDYADRGNQFTSCIDELPSS
ncbi:MAG: UDP-N-acetylmuramoyl-L-alanine--D-glutamate ligase [Anaerolineae bacterium]|nr:UDP-N-acetylmuramoyl-L-alanine--D-glutamate ligase [Anaerolineae bacterium]